MTIAIVPAAGSGRRLKAREKKPFIILGGKPLIAHVLKALGSSKYIDGIIVAVEALFIERLKGIITKYGLKKIVKVVRGGKARGQSVRNCFNAVNKHCNIVLIHDGARPFLQDKMIRDCIEAAKKFGACITAIPATDTIKLADKSLFIKDTLDRRYIWRAQTPQAFRYGILKEALSRVKGAASATDDSFLVERLGKRVKILEGSERNIKVTTREDLKIAEVLLCE